MYLGKGIKTIAKETFRACTSLTGIEIPDGVESIGTYAFYGNVSMKYIKMPPSMKTIGSYAFEPYSQSGGYKSRSLYITDLEAWCNVSFSDSGAAVHAGSIYLNDEMLTDLVIPDGVTKINKYAFYSCSRLTSLVIPESVTSIGNQAFDQCGQLLDIECKSSTPPTGTSTMFGSLKQNRKIYVPMEAVEAYKAAEGWINYADIIVGKFSDILR